MMIVHEDLSRWIAQFSHAVEARDLQRIGGMFADRSYWRDILAFTWDLRTFEGKEQILHMLDRTLADVRPTNWSVVPASLAANSSEGWITFDTALGLGAGYIRLTGGLCATLLTTLQELKGFEERTGARRSRGAEYGVSNDTRNWLDQRRADSAAIGVTKQPFVIIVGGGQGGLALGARLKMLDVPALIVDRHPRTGDQWRARYKSLALHDPVWYDHMPYLPFPETWPIYTPKDKMGDWLESYASIMELDVWNSTACTGASFDESTQDWRVELEKNGEPLALRTSHLVIATGNAGKARVPQFPGAGSFAGTQYHSSQHPGGDGFAGKRVVVVGSNNSAHDICADLWQHGADVTMIQRSSTHVSRSQTLMELTLAPLYSQAAVTAGMTTDKADLLLASVPLRLLPDAQRPVYQEMARRDADFYLRLERAGFTHDFGEDGSGLYLKYLRRAGGYYIDVGASELIADGRIKLRSRVTIRQIEPGAVILSDGSKLAADTIIYATGYGSMDEWIADIVSPDVAAKVGKVWGYGSGTTGDPGPWEGELRNMWKPTRQTGLWFHGGNLAQSRQYSRYLALQLKARFENVDVNRLD